MQKVIQSDGQAVLNVCGCGRLHFTYGPLTLHLSVRNSCGLRAKSAGWRPAYSTLSLTEGRFSYPNRTVRFVTKPGVFMKIQHCPRCQQRSLISTGAFWACGSCGYAITQAALFLDHAGTQARDRQITPGSRAGKHTTA
jgi:ribosomal protein S27AE